MYIYRCKNENVFCVFGVHKYFVSRWDTQGKRRENRDNDLSEKIKMTLKRAREIEEQYKYVNIATTTMIPPSNPSSQKQQKTTVVLCKTYV